MYSMPSSKEDDNSGNDEELIRQVDSLLYEGKNKLIKNDNYMEYGDYMNYITNLENSNVYFEKALCLSKSIVSSDQKNNQIRIINNLLLQNFHDLGSSYREIRLFNKALENDNRAINILLGEQSTSDNELSAPQRRFNSFFYESLVFDYYFIGNKDSMFYYYKKFIDSKPNHDKQCSLIHSLCDNKRNNLRQSGYEYINETSYDRFIDNEYFRIAIEIADKEDNLLLLSDLLRNFLNQIKVDIKKSFCKLGITGRSNFWRVYKYYIDFILTQAINHRNSDDFLKIAYDACVLSKGLMLFSEIEILNIIKKNEHKDAMELWRKITELRMRNLENSDDCRKLEQRLVRMIPRYDRTADRVVLGWTDIQIAMKTNDVCVEFIKVEDKKRPDTDTPLYVALVIRKNSLSPICIEIMPENKLKSHLSLGSDFYKNKEIGNTVWKEIIDKANVTIDDNIYFSCDGTLHQVAIEYLLSPRKGIPINNIYNMIRMSNTKEICFKKTGVTFEHAALFGGIYYDEEQTGINGNERGISLSYLPASKEEVDQVEKLLKLKDCEILKYCGKDGSKENFKKLSGKKINILHLATHGFQWTERVSRHLHMSFSNDSISEESKIMNRSGLFFSDANYAFNAPQENHTYNGIVTSNEISVMDLSNLDIAVLSACKSGKGVVLDDGVYGLQRAFKKAGCQSLLMSLWNVDDKATQLFMVHFYDLLLKGATMHNAMRESQDFVKKVENGKYNDPLYWAAFILLDSIQ